MLKLLHDDKLSYEDEMYHMILYKYCAVLKLLCCAVLTNLTKTIGLSLGHLFCFTVLTVLKRLPSYKVGGLLIIVHQGTKLLYIL